MKLRELFEFFVEQGISKDPRGIEAVNGLLTEEKKKFEKLSDEEKKDYDRDRLTNPYLDSRILNGSGDEEIKTVITGIDMETPETAAGLQLEVFGKEDRPCSHASPGRQGLRDVL